MTLDVAPAISAVLHRAAEDVRASSGRRAGDLVEQALLRTLRETITRDADGSAFVITGDIPAMWLRDSTTQMLPYLRFLAECPALAELLAAVSRRQLRMIDHDPFANSFNLSPTGAHHDPRDLCTDPLVWEQKYEVDSLAYPVLLLHRLVRGTGDPALLDATARRVLETVVRHWRREQDHEQRSEYRFVRDIGIPTETLERDGRGTQVAVTGMTWSGFRPSDDACTYGYNIPANMLAAQALLAIADLARRDLGDDALAEDADALRAEMLEGVARHGIVDREGERIYAYEVDGLGGILLMDDANTPSLLSLPLDAPDVLDPEVAEATRRFVLGSGNPFRYTGTAATGIGSPHTPEQHVWPIAFAVEGLTGTPARAREVLDLLLATDAGTDRMHESFHVDDPSVYTRPWFSWADSMFCELALSIAEGVATGTGGTSRT